MACKGIPQLYGWKIRLCSNFTDQISSNPPQSCYSPGTWVMTPRCLHEATTKHNLETLTKPTVATCKTANKSSIPMLVNSFTLKEKRGEKQTETCAARKQIIHRLRNNSFYPQGLNPTCATLLGRPSITCKKKNKFYRSKLRVMILYRPRSFYDSHAHPRTSFNQLGCRRSAKVSKEEGRGCVWSWAESVVGAWPYMNVVIHKNSELLHSKEDLAAGCLFIYVWAKIIFVMLLSSFHTHTSVQLLLCEK